MKCRNGSRTLVCLMVVGLALSAPGADPAVPPAPAVVLTVTTPPVMDGILAEPFWKQAAVQGDFTLLGSAHERVGDTTFRLACDDAWLYLGVDCRNPDMSALQPVVKGHDRNAFRDESVELFLGPGTDGAVYCHYILSFANAKDERIVTRGTIKEYWDVPWRSATRVREDGWSAEIAIPLNVLASLGNLAKLRINVARNRRVPTIDLQHVVIEERKECSSWSPVAGKFHDPQAFRAVTGFAENLKVRIPPLAQIADARVQPYYSKDGRTYYDVHVELKGYSSATTAVCVAVLDRPVSGAPREIVETITLTNTAPVQVRMAMPVDGACSREVSVLLKDPAAGETLETFPIEDTAAIHAMSAFLDRSYYTTEREALALCRVGLPPDTRQSLRLEVRAADGTVLARQRRVATDNRVAVPLKRLPLGASTLEVVLCEKGQAPFFSLPLDVIRRAPQPGLEWKIDRERRVVLNNGRPFFPFGMVMSGVKAGDPIAFKKLADHNFNTFSVWAKSTPEALAEFQKNAAAHGLFTVTAPDECATAIEWESHKRYSGALLEQVKRATEDPSLASMKNVLVLPIPVAARNAIYDEFYNKNIERCIRGVEAVKGWANLTSYFIMDEPMSAQYFDQYKFGQDYYARIHRADGYRPVIVNYSSFIPEGDQYVNWCDILMTDPYWYPPATNDTRTTPNHVSKITWMTNRRALSHRQPVWEILAGPRWSRCFKRPLDQREIRAQTYLALIHRATGIFYFTYPSVRAADWVTFRQLGAEMKVLGSFAVGPALEQEITYRRALLAQPDEAPVFADTPFNPPKEQYPDVQAVVLADESGGRLLLAANSRHYPVACRFEIPRLRQAVPEFGGDAPGVREAAFTDTLEPYATRAWRLDLKSGAAPLQLTVLQTVLAGDLPNPETVLPNAWRKDRRNGMPNPSFEDVTAEGCPDYCLVSAGTTVQDGDALFGRRCVKLEKTGSSGFEQFMMHSDPQEREPQTYTLSIYLKGSREGLKAWLRGTQMNREKPYGECTDITLTTAWKRYAITGVIPAKVSEAVYEVRLRDPGTMWVDGVQLERGPVPSEFEE